MVIDLRKSRTFTIISLLVELYYIFDLHQLQYSFTRSTVKNCNTEQRCQVIYGHPNNLLRAIHQTATWFGNDIRHPINKASSKWFNLLSRVWTRVSFVASFNFLIASCAPEMRWLQCIWLLIVQLLVEAVQQSDLSCARSLLVELDFRLSE